MKTKNIVLLGRKTIRKQYAALPSERKKQQNDSGKLIKRCWYEFKLIFGLIQPRYVFRNDYTTLKFLPFEVNSFSVPVR